MLQQLCNKISIFLLQIKQAFAVSFGHSKVNHFMANFEWPYDTFAQYIEPISKYCFNKLIFERFLTHKLTLSSTGLFSHPFLSHIIKKIARVRCDRAFRTFMSIFCTKWIFDRFEYLFSTFYCSHMGWGRSVPFVEPRITFDQNLTIFEKLAHHHH